MLLSIRRSNDVETNKHIVVIIVEKPLIAFKHSAICGERTVNCGPSTRGKDEGRDYSLISISEVSRILGEADLKRFEQARLSGLDDRPPSGRPLEITALERHQVIASACRAPKDLGVARNTWNHESLREVLRNVCCNRGAGRGNAFIRNARLTE